MDLLSGKLSYGIIGNIQYKDKKIKVITKSRKHIVAGNWFEAVRKHCTKDEIPILQITNSITGKNYIIMEADLFWNEILPRLKES